MVKSRNVAGRMILCISIITIFFLYVIAMFYHVQIRRHTELLEKARNKYITKDKTQGKRGEIYDKNGSLLVGNLPCFKVCADPSLTGDENQCRDLARFLSPIIDQPEDEIFQKLMKKNKTVKNKAGKLVTVKNQYVVLDSEIDFDAGTALRDALRARKCKAVFLQESFKRFYPKKQLLSNILGITQADRDNYIAIVGVEKFYNAQMMAKGGVRYYERTRKGAPIAYGKITTQEVKDGLNIYLTIDEALQTIVEEELDKLYASKYKPKNCYAILVDPWTGDILAIAQRPTFDPNNRKSIKAKDWRNKLAEDTYEPGSIMKPITIAGAIDRGVVTPNTIINCEKKKWYYGGASLGDDHWLGPAPVSKVLIQSSNIGTAKISLMMGNESLYGNLRNFGFAQKTGIPLEIETSGILRPLRRWRKITPTRVSIGQSINVSTLQMARAYCMLANGGRPLKLNLVDRIEDPATGKIEKIERKPGPSIFRQPDTGRIITDMMVGVTVEGTGKKAAVPGYHVAGKTGTAQQVVNGRYDKRHYVSSFAGFVPAYNPRFVLIVAAVEPDRKAGYYASAVAAPVFKSIAERALEYMGVPKDFEPEVKPKKVLRKKKTASIRRKR